MFGKKIANIVFSKILRFFHLLASLLALSAVCPIHSALRKTKTLCCLNHPKREHLPTVKNRTKKYSCCLLAMLLNCLPGGASDRIRHPSLHHPLKFTPPPSCTERLARPSMNSPLWGSLITLSPQRVLSFRIPSCACLKT